MLTNSLLSSLALLVSISLLGMVLITLTNVLTFPRLNRYKDPKESGLVSILIPARNEASRIRATLQSLLNQEDVRFEILVLDDHSTDSTNRVALEIGEADPRLRILEGLDLPEGWGGKNWACHQLSKEAAGDWLVFTDADVLWGVGSLKCLLAFVQSSRADMATVWPTQKTVTWGERLIVPLMAMAIIAYLPVLAVHYIPWPVFSAANGQCLVFNRKTYDAIGGHEAVKNSVIEDIHLAWKVKADQFRLRMADGAGLITCRMYQNWPEVRDGYAKNLLAGHGRNLFLLTLSGLFHWLVFIGPWIWLTTGFFISTWMETWPAWPLLLIGLGIGVRALTAAFTRQRISDAFWMPVSVILMTRIALLSGKWQIKYGGPVWKGRILSKS